MTIEQLMGEVLEVEGDGSVDFEAAFAQFREARERNDEREDEGWTDGLSIDLPTIDGVGDDEEDGGL